MFYTKKNEETPVSDQNVMAVLIEPAPYIVSLVDELGLQWEGSFEAWFVSRSVTQVWAEGGRENKNCNFLPEPKLRAIINLFRSFLRFRPRVLFVAGWGHPITVVAIILGRIFGAKVVVMSDTWTSATTGIRFRFKLVVLRLVHRFTPGGKRQRKYLLDLGVSKNQIFVSNMTSNTREMRDYMETEGQNDRQSLRKKMNADSDDVVFLFVGRLEAIKGIDYLVSAFTADRLPKNARLVVVGEGSMRESVIDACHKNNKIEYRGRMEGESLWAQFASADILIVPSRKEPWGLVVNEAMVAHLGVIAHDCCGCIDDLVMDGFNGYVVPTGDSFSLNEALCSLSQKLDQVSVFKGNSGVVIKGWTTEAWAKNIIRAWKDSLGNLPK